MSASATPALRLHTDPGSAKQLARIALWPVLVGSCYAAMVRADLMGLQDPTRATLSVGMILVVTLLERWLPLDPAQLLRADRRCAHDVGHIVLNTLAQILFTAVLVAIPLVVAAPLAQLAGGSPWPSHWSWAAQCVIALVVADFLGYWVHRLEHRSPLLWAYHVVHHDLDRLHIFKGTREHFVTNIVRGALVLAPLLALGAPIEALFFYQTLVVTQASIAHANLELRFPDFLHRFVVTPPVHRIHHAEERMLSDSNYSSITPLWDHLFGSYTDPTRLAPPAIGVEHSTLPESFCGQLAHPFRVWLRLG